MDVRAVIERSVAANERDWKAEPLYECLERDKHGGETRTYRNFMLYGSPYQELIAVDGKPLSAEQQKEQQEKLNREIAHRRAESPDERRQRIEKYEKDRRRDHLLMQQLTKAFDFKLLGSKKLAGRDVWVLEATPRAGYRPPNTETQVLTGMQGKLWIDKKDFQWVKVEATVVHPVYVEGFLAQVQPGTMFELEKRPVAPGIWLPSHFAMKSHAKILWIMSRRSAEDDTYFDYRPAGAPAALAANASNPAK